MKKKLRTCLTFIFAFTYFTTFILMLFIASNVFPGFISGAISIIASAMLVILAIGMFSVYGILEYIGSFHVRRFIKKFSKENREKLKPKKIFKINDIVEMKLISGETYIYIKGKEFKQCKFLLLNIPIEEVEDYDEYESIDDIAEELDHSLEMGPYYNNIKKIDPETEFWGHCSNLQAFFENGLNTNILHSNIAFPLLKELCEVGYKPAYLKFREEIVRRFNAGNESVKVFLFLEEYLTYLNKEELECLDGYDEFKSKYGKAEMWSLGRDE
ncbi:hypothetical protein LCGC14_1972290 [marine sediment metagenome]|uniref:Uncharacterized protein n=1 Tax=marine sediment metagenome TaxID=412755 RepID=A0A0F9FBC8_9ZZZZ